MTDVLTLEERLDLTAAKPLAEALLARSGTDLTLDASKVNLLGTPCLQVLCAARAHWAGAGRSLTYSAMSKSCREQLALFGMAPEDLQSGSSAA